MDEIHACISQTARDKLLYCRATAEKLESLALLTAKRSWKACRQACMADATQPSGGTAEDKQVWNVTT
jgi:hypothetical protein